MMRINFRSRGPRRTWSDQQVARFNDKFFYFVMLPAFVAGAIDDPRILFALLFGLL